MTSRLAIRRAAAGLALVAAIAAAGCATPYQAKGLTGGFSDKQVAPGRYTVEFVGNGYSTDDLVANMYLYRCAELTAQNGFDVFRSMAPDVAARSTGWVSAPAPVQAMAGDANDAAEPTGFQSGGASAVPIYVPGGAVAVRTVKGVVQMGRYADVPSNVRVWDARLVMKTLEPVVKGDGKAKGLRAEDVAKTAMVSGRGRAQARGGTSLDDLQRLLQQGGERP